MTGEDFDDSFAEPDGLDDLDVFGSSGGSEADARLAGDDGVPGLDKITAQMSGGEHRPEQQEMCRAVAEAIVTRTHLVVQAGTGTGKSLAYLVPAALSGKKVVIATATKALQDQLAEKDLPQVDAGLGLPAPLDFAVLKGRSNYVCRQRVAEVGSGGIQAELGDQGAGRADEPATVPTEDSESGASFGGAARRHCRGSAPAGGLVTEIPDGRPGRPELRALRPGLEHGQRGPRECPGAYNCPSGGSCFAEAARERASVADVVVVNTHLYGAHLASGSVVLPEHDVVIFDEAHELEEVMTSSLGVEVTPGRFRSLVTSGRSLVEPKDADLLDPLARWAISSGRCSPTGWAPVCCTTRPGRRWTTANWPSCSARGAEVSRRVTDALRRGGAQRSFLPEGGGPTPIPTAPAARPARCRPPPIWPRTCTASRPAATARWPGSTARGATSGSASPPLTSALCSSTMLWGEVTSVLTSATIPPRIVERVGLEAFPTEELNVGSPFDYRSHALLYVARHLPDRRAAGAEEALHEELSQLLEAAGGRTLALFTSRRATEAAAAALAPELPYTLLLQGDLPKNLLLEKFAADETSCLFATMGFWQGVDVPGRALSLVTIDKLPFPRPDDPLLQARRDRAGGGAFSLVDLPRAATLLAQGAGRLIRNAEDRGVVAVLDPRLATASYRGVLLATLPPMRRSVERDEVESFLRRALDVEPGP